MWKFQLLVKAGYNLGLIPDKRSEGKKINRVEQRFFPTWQIISFQNYYIA